MYSIILAFRVLEAKIGHPGPIASPAAEDGSGWRRCGTGWRRLRGCDASQRADFRRPFGNRTGTSGYRHSGGKQVERFRYAAVLPELLTRADGIRFGRKDTAEPSGRGASSRRRFCRRSSSTRRNWSGVQGRRASVSASKIRPGPSSAMEADVRTRIPSAPAPLRHRDSAPEAPPSRSSTARAALPCPIPPTGLGDVRSSERHPASPPLSRKTSDLPPGIGISIGPPILISTKQQASKTTQLHNDTTTQQHNNTTTKQQNSKAMTSVSTEVSQY